MAHSLFQQFQNPGLIEAYWNVNVVGAGVEFIAGIGLIEAYWNVN